MLFLIGHHISNLKVAFELRCERFLYSSILKCPLFFEFGCSVQMSIDLFVYISMLSVFNIMFYFHFDIIIPLHIDVKIPLYFEVDMSTKFRNFNVGVLVVFYLSFRVPFKMYMSIAL